MRKLFSFVFLGALLVGPYSVHAARIFLDPTTTEVSRSDTFYVPVRIDAQGECINAAHVTLSYDPTVLSIQDITTGDSIFTLWTVPPRIERDGIREIGTVLFEGGVPGGYCGRVEGDPGLTNTLVRLVVSTVPGALSASSTDRASIVVVPDTQVILHDGRGTPAPLTVQGTDLTLRDTASSTNNVWLTDVKNDTIAPEFFEVTLVEGPSVGNSKHYIVFSTVDKQSGIDHYEVLETDPDRFGFLTWVPREAHWVRGESPYILRDQELHSTIMVKAVDKAGNERTIEYTPPMSALTQLTQPLVIVPVFIVFVCVALSMLFIHRLRVRRARRAVSSQPHDSYGA